MEFKSFAYSGRKLKYLDLINEHIADANNEVLIEPMCGSGVVSLNNTTASYKLLNDISSEVMLIHSAFKTSDYDRFNNFVTSNRLQLKSLSNKDFYYSFRDMYNKTLHNKKTIETGYALYFLAGGCINSMLRFGPNGMNQGSGCRDNSDRFDEEQFNLLHTAYESCELFNIDWLEFLQYTKSKNVTMFFDPPYYGTGQVYKSNLTVLDSKVKVLEYLKSLQMHILYTDRYHDFDANILGWNYDILRETMNSSAPYTLTDRTIQTQPEVVYDNQLYER